MEKVRELIDRLESQRILTKEEFCFLIESIEPEDRVYLYERARSQARAVYGNAIYVRGLIEFTNFCRNDCYYCGIRRGNRQASRYRLTREEILECCKEGYALGFRTFVLQGGEDPWFDDDKIAGLVREIKEATVRLPFRWGNTPMRPIRNGLMPERTGICFGTRRQIPSTTRSFIRQLCPWHIGCSACGT